MRTAKRYVLALLIGAVAYWIPEITIQWVHPPEKVWMASLTFVVPLVVVVVWYPLSTAESFHRYPVGFPLSMSFGIWLFGPLAMTIGGSLMGGKFVSPEQLQSFFIVWAAFPLTTFMLATYRGSLGGLIFATL